VVNHRPAKCDGVNLPTGLACVPVRTRPPDLDDADVIAAVERGWVTRASSAEYVPEGGGSHHWSLTDQEGRAFFVTVDDLDDKDWMAHTREATFDGLVRALSAAASLRDNANLDFVVVPLPSIDGSIVRRLRPRYALSVYPFLVGQSFAFGPHTDPSRRHEVLEMIIHLHQATRAARGARFAEPTFGGRVDLETALRVPRRDWDAGPFAHATEGLVAKHASALVRLLESFDRIVVATSRTRSDPVITHGEPHAGNVMSVDGRLMLIDWDTLALGSPERDLWMIATDRGEEVVRYSQATGRRIDPLAMTLYRLRWYLDDVASAIRMFHRPHDQTEDTQRWWHGLAPLLEEVPHWNETLARLIH
jgi:spectinomycin phosphotransferase